MTPTRMFRHTTKKVGNSAHALNKFACEISLDTDLKHLEAWAKKCLRSAGWPTSWKESVKIPRGRAIKLSLVPPDTIEWYAAQTLFFVNGTRDHLESGNAEDAVWCAIRAMEHYWIALIERKLARSYLCGQKQLAGSRKGQAARRTKSKPRHDRLQQLLTEFPKSVALCKAGEEFGIKPDTVRRRYLTSRY